MNSRREKDLIVVARSLFELIKHEDDLKCLGRYRKFLLNAKSVFDAHYDEEGTLHADLGLELFEFYLFKMGGDEKETESYKKIPEDIIKDLEKRYGIAPK
jgi:hypothetical protein